MTSDVRRIYVEKKEDFRVEAENLCSDIKENLQVLGLSGVRIINRYDVVGISDDEYQKAKYLVFSEPPVDYAHDEEIELSGKVFAIEYLPGQYDQRADSASECIQILTCGTRPQVKVAKIIALIGDISDSDFLKIKKYCINPVEAREATLEKPTTLDDELFTPEDVITIDGFIKKDTDALTEFLNTMGFAMDLDDIMFCQEYFIKTEKRDPTLTEMRMIDTYWSDHCRHTTFSTKIDNVEILEGSLKTVLSETYNEYLNSRQAVYGERIEQKNICLMDVATIAMKELKKDGKLSALDESEEINACSIVVNAEIDGKNEDWLVMFKNETHNHPTEIEPFGGAATCIGGAIRDPLSGRVYVYQAMRVTGSADPRATMAQTLPNKLMQKKITRGAAAGYSSYGNQIGLATGQVKEIYHPGYMAKRMEIGAVIGAAPKANVVREVPTPGDVVILLGGRTGRDGCGGATGSSKAHTEESLKTCGAEVQKGNAPVERKIQRLFRNDLVTKLIKRCNDFGAGGVSVAIGELADGLVINLDKVTKKYEGLDGTELAISESQERMAVVVKSADQDLFIKYANDENLEATVVAEVTDTYRLKMLWRGQVICDISREFLNTNGATKHTDAVLVSPKADLFYASTFTDMKTKWLETLSDINVCGQKGLGERFDSTIGAGSVLMPFGGKYQLTPAEGMAAKLPVLSGDTNTATLMSYGYNPYLSEQSQFHGAVYAVLESVAKVVAMGGNYKLIYLTFQEYFERLGNDAKRWGKPLSSLLGAYWAQKRLGIAAIGGKDSMSGTFNELSVPPTLVSFAVAPIKADKVLSPEFKAAGNVALLFKIKCDENNLPDIKYVDTLYSKIHQLAGEGKIISARSVGYGGICQGISEMCFGNKLGFLFDDKFDDKQVFDIMYGSLIVEVQKDTIADFSGLAYTPLGEITDKAAISIRNTEISIDDALQAWLKPLEKIFPTKVGEAKEICSFSYPSRGPVHAKNSFAKPKVFIPVFPGTNCEYDTKRAFLATGAEVDVFVINNLTPSHVAESMSEMAKKIKNSQIVMIPGGFSGGDEPDGSGKFIATAFRHDEISTAIMELLNARDGLILGICNGFQALIKLGLLPFGEIRPITADSPTLTFNKIGRHISNIAHTRVASVKSPWFSKVALGDIHSVAVSHGEGRFVANADWIKKLEANGQIATQYVDLSGTPTTDTYFNPNGSVCAIEGIFSECGRVFGKMGHSERRGSNVFINVPGNKEQFIFESGVAYFK